MRKKCEELYQRLEADLEEQESKEQSPMEMLRNGLHLTQTTLDKMKMQVQENGFASQTEEIEFFKFVKPKVYGLLVYVSERYSVENSRPILISELDDFYNGQLKHISRFFRQHEFLYQYYKLGAVEMDQYYFLRGKKPDGVISLDLPELDTTFATYGDYLFAKFIGYEKMQNLILSKIKQVSFVPEPSSLPINKEPNSLLKWTGDKTNLVELIYGLFYTGQLNNGNATIADIIKWMEYNLKIDLSRSYKNFIDIKNRKRDSPTRFLDKMRDFILQRIDEDLKYKPNRGINLIEDRGNK